MGRIVVAALGRGKRDDDPQFRARAFLSKYHVDPFASSLPHSFAPAPAKRKMRLLNKMPVNNTGEPAYLQPYSRAVKRHGADFRALLWASRRTQSLRFDALIKLADPTGLTVLDLGCGRADLLDFLIERNQTPAKYIGLEGVRELANAAAVKHHSEANCRTRCRILIADFVREPKRMQLDADVILCSGALNTIDDAAFYATIEHAFAAARNALVFNFLSSDLLAGTNYLRWRERRDVLAFTRTLTPHVQTHEGYIDGDCTIGLYKKHKERKEIA